MRNIDSSFSAALVSAIKEAAPSTAAAKEQMDPGLANPLLSSVQSLPVGAGASSKPGAVELGAVILRAWRSTLAAFAAHFQSLSEGERASIATALTASSRTIESSVPEIPRSAPRST